MPPFEMVGVGWLVVALLLIFVLGFLACIIFTIKDGFKRK